MKKVFNVILSILMLSISIILIACQAKLVCISHIDRDGDGKCDNCHQKLGEVVKSNIESLTLSKQPDKLYFAINESLDVSGGKLLVTFNDGTADLEITLPNDDVTVVAPGMESKGDKYVLLQYKDKTVRYLIEVGDPKFLVSFNLGYEASEPLEPVEVIINSLVEVPEEPQRLGFDFMGWYTTSEFDNLFDFNLTHILADTTIYAKWIQKYTVTYNLNYDGATNEQGLTVRGKAQSKSVSNRGENGAIVFTGWYSDPECENMFSFDTNITSDITIYAGWQDTSAQELETFHVSFDLNYSGADEMDDVEVLEGLKVAQPASPTREGIGTKGHQVSQYTFIGWYTDSACTTAYDFNTSVSSDFTLYAKWTATYIFEAEHVMLVDDNGQPTKGMGASGGAEGRNMVDPPGTGQEGINASNGYYVTYLFQEDLFIQFVITSDREVEDATLIFRISCESMGFALDPILNDGETENGTLYSCYQITINGEPIIYPTIEITDAQGHEATGGKRPFSDHVLTTTLHLEEGVNVIRFTTANSHGMGGTMAGTAPVIDCIKITTSAELSWDPITGNEFGQ